MLSFGHRPSKICVREIETKIVLIKTTGNAWSTVNQPLPSLLLTFIGNQTTHLTFWFRRFNPGVTKPDIAEHLVVHRIRQYCWHWIGRSHNTMYICRTAPWYTVRVSSFTPPSITATLDHCCIPHRKQGEFKGQMPACLGMQLVF